MNRNWPWYMNLKPIPLTGRSKVWVMRPQLPGVASSNSVSVWMSAWGESCVLSGRGLCVGLITHTEDSYRVWCGWEWSWSFDNEDALAHKYCYAMKKKMNLEADTREVWEWLVSRFVFLSLWIFFVWYSDLNVFRKTHLAATLSRQVSQQTNIFKLKIKIIDLLSGFWIAKILRVWWMVDEWNMSKDCWLSVWLTDWLSDWLTVCLSDWLIDFLTDWLILTGEN